MPGPRFARLTASRHLQLSVRGIRFYLLACGWACFARSFGGLTMAAEPGEPRFNRDIRPILAESCFQCHGQDEQARAAGLRLDLRESALKGGESGSQAILPGQPEQSELLRRINSVDPEEQMPPPDSGKELTAVQKEVLSHWIAAGATYEGHWAFTAPRRPDLPEPAVVPGSPGDGSPTSSSHPIDLWINERLRKEGLTPQPEAAPETLLRRLYLDLVGIPPTVEAVRTFATDYQLRGNVAYLEQVELLLAKPQFGEKWARHWLDAARYADSNGYEKDLPREQWIWRDWVIDALNRDMPYDQFLTEQLAGDLLPHATQSQHVATGFLRNGMVNEEGAILYEQFRIEGMFDRLDCVGKAVLGLTLQCAQCHSHKFDPLTHQEYFGLYALLNNTYEKTMWYYTPAQQRTMNEIRAEIAQQDADLKKALSDWQTRLKAWEDQLRSTAPDWQILEPTENEFVGGVAHPQKLPDNSVITLGFRPSDGDVYVIVENTPQVPLTGLRVEALTHGDLPFGGPGRNQLGTFAVSELSVEYKLKSGGDWKPLKLQNPTADFSPPEGRLAPQNRRSEEDARKLGPAAFLIDGDENTAWSGDRGPGRRHVDTDWVAQFAPDNAWPAERYSLRVWMKYRHSGADIHGSQSLYLARFRLSATSSPSPQADLIGTEAAQALQVPVAERTPLHEQALFTAWRSHPLALGSSADSASTAHQVLQASNDKVEAAWKRFPEADSVLVLGERTPEWTRKTHRLDRGAWDQPKEEIAGGVPAFLHPLPASEDPGRLALAKWLASKQSPTTARVFVNRAWQALFGSGLVDTPEDLGIRAPLPTHPELLDSLAVEVMEPQTAPTGVDAQAWSLKHLLRLMVTSAAYRRDSRATPELLERDPGNKLLARGPRFRAEAEVVRDLALAVSGLLQPTVGGRSFYPPVPPSMFEANYVKIDWKTAPAPERYRRSLYMFRRRSMPDPVLSSMDAPNGDFACARRVRSNTPLAALTLLNEPVFVDAARALALRAWREGGETDESRLNYAFQLCTARLPTADEVQVLQRLLESRQAHLAEGWTSAKEMAFGDVHSTVALPSNCTPAKAAAWTVVARVLLNLDETVTKN